MVTDKLRKQYERLLLRSKCIDRQLAQIILRTDNAVTSLHSEFQAWLPHICLMVEELPLKIQASVDKTSSVVYLLGEHEWSPLNHTHMRVHTLGSWVLVQPHTVSCHFYTYGVNGHGFPGRVTFISMGLMVSSSCSNKIWETSHQLWFFT